LRSDFNALGYLGCLSDVSAFFSPGICPQSWDGGGTTIKFGTTTINCCPPGFTLGDTLCKSTVAANPTTSVILYMSTTRKNTLPTSTWIKSGTVWASGVQVRFRDGDFDTTSSSSSSSSTPTPSASSTTSIALGGSTAPPDTSGSGGVVISQPGGLSNGAKIGIGIGIPLAAIGLGILAFLLFWRRRKAKQAAAEAAAAAGADAGASAAPAYPPGQGPPGGPQPQMVQKAPLYPSGAPYQGMAQTYAAGPKELASAEVAPVAVAGYYNAAKQPPYSPHTSEIYTPAQEIQRKPLGAASELGGSPPAPYDPRYSVASAGSPPLYQTPPAQYQPTPPGQGYVAVPTQSRAQSPTPAHEVDAGFGGFQAQAGPLPSPAELYPDRGEDGVGDRR